MSSDPTSPSPLLAALRERAVAGRLLAILLGNGVLGLFVVRGRIEPLYLVLLVAIEALCLAIVEAVELRFVPVWAVEPALRQRSVRRLLLLGFIMAVLLFFNGLILFAQFDEQEVRAFLRQPLSGLAASNIAWPLAVTLVFALVDAARDLRRYAAEIDPARRQKFESTPGKSAQARWMTLILSALPHAIPFISLFAIVGRYVAARQSAAAAGERRPFPKTAIVLLAALVGGVLLFVSWMLSSGVTGWTVAFCVGKIFSEGLILALPIVAPAQLPRERLAAPGAVGGKPGRRARRKLRRASAAPAGAPVAVRSAGE